MESAQLRDYESALLAERARFAASATLRDLLSPAVAPDRLHLFLTHFCALGVSMTEPVERWIRRAGQRCQDLGLVRLGRFLVEHARHEAGHHEMMIEDTRHLCSRWNSSGRPPLDADRLLALAMPDGVRRYRDLHEEVIASDRPFRQLAIEYEIERLSVAFGPRLIDHCARLLGPGIVDGLSFVREHARLDQGHTRMNATQMETLLFERPDALPHLIDTGGRALWAYGAFLDDCARLSARA
jgi:hypothetical protein